VLNILGYYVDAQKQAYLQQERQLQQQQIKAMTGEAMTGNEKR